MELTPENYEELLSIYNDLSSNTVISDIKDDDDILREVACTWLKREAWSGAGMNYEQWIHNVGSSKQKLRIGGIFPITGEKFSAPELLPGESGFDDASFMAWQQKARARESA